MILGHERQIEYFNNVLKHGRLAHAYLLYGPEHVGKFMIAKEFAKALYCEKSAEQIDVSCGVCSACRQIEAGEHPSVIVLDRETTLVSKKDIRKEIPIEDIREVKRRFSFAARPDETRVVIINGAEYLSSEAANAFLKLLEEPGARTLCLLISHDRDSLLPTIISRTQGIRFSLVADSVLKPFLSRSGSEQSVQNDILRFAAGRPGVAVQLVGDTVLLKEECAFSIGIERMIKAGIPQAFVWSEKVAGDEELRKKTITYIVEALRAQLFESGRDAQERASLLKRMKEIDRVATICATTNVNPRLALDMIFIASVGI